MTARFRILREALQRAHTRTAPLPQPLGTQPPGSFEGLLADPLAQFPLPPGLVIFDPRPPSNTLSTTDFESAEAQQEPAPDGDTCRPVQIDGETIRVHGTREMTEQERGYLSEVITAARRRYAAEHADQVATGHTCDRTTEAECPACHAAEQALARGETHL